MKFIIKLESGQTEPVEELVGACIGETRVEKLVKPNLYRPDGSSENVTYLFCTGTFKEYLSWRKFFSKNQVQKYNW